MVDFDQFSFFSLSRDIASALKYFQFVGGGETVRRRKGGGGPHRPRQAAPYFLGSIGRVPNCGMGTLRCSSQCFSAGQHGTGGVYFGQVSINNIVLDTYPYQKLVFCNKWSSIMVKCCYQY